jgi:hypothetical protein
VLSWHSRACRGAPVVLRSPISCEYPRIVCPSSLLLLCNVLRVPVWDVLRVLCQHILPQNHQRRVWIVLVWFCDSIVLLLICFGSSRVCWVISRVVSSNLFASSPAWGRPYMPLTTSR